MDTADSANLPVTPLARYHAELARLGWSSDPAQERVAARLDALYAALAAWQPPRRRLFGKPRLLAPVPAPCCCLCHFSTGMARAAPAGQGGMGACMAAGGGGATGSGQPGAKQATKKEDVWG
jgi:hypothetical protein